MCVPFGKGADGTVLGEGAVTVVLRPLQAALERNEPHICSHQRQPESAQEAGSVGFTAPNPNAQSRLHYERFSLLMWDPDTVTYIETHEPALNSAIRLKFAGFNWHTSRERRAVP